MKYTNSFNDDKSKVCIMKRTVEGDNLLLEIKPDLFMSFLNRNCFTIDGNRNISSFGFNGVDGHYSDKWTKYDKWQAPTIRLVSEHKELYSKAIEKAELELQILKAKRDNFI